MSNITSSVFDCFTNNFYKVFIDNFNDKITPEMKQKAVELGMTLDEIITLASIIQKECDFDITECANVASVFHNRLKSPSFPKLESDVTTFYIKNSLGDYLGYQKDAEGNEEHVFSTKYGFRHIEIKNNKVYINGELVLFKGANLQDTHPVTGRSVDIETMLCDVKMMKQANMNTVRTSHYPRQAKMNAMFDYYGLYCMDEADLECHKSWEDGGENRGITNEESWRAQYIDRTVRMVYRDRNFPSIIFWSLGNESGGGKNFNHIAVFVLFVGRPDNADQFALGLHFAASATLPERYSSLLHIFSSVFIKLFFLAVESAFGANIYLPTGKLGCKTNVLTLCADCKRELICINVNSAGSLACHLDLAYSSGRKCCRNVLLGDLAVLNYIYLLASELIYDACYSHSVVTDTSAYCINVIVS